ncbi:hypothetical protein PtA15_10A562 [Puccinia triticina]|uniref:Uncharacterized protein n=1 Tax=Puccinia triticina TaxID=208348 RepID=A0ABY7CV15_9BASI|nr:uncharacterized protein PtA15_10A562 [Puccinia triticina]WAQ89138.1 hypothetical protein PtA15_10A562 [Puccinia triticina]WAR59194.1 hypothetical protein PtB15_10B536 [Puccinia triticina]
MGGSRAGREASARAAKTDEGVEHLLVGRSAGSASAALLRRPPDRHHPPISRDRLGASFASDRHRSDSHGWAHIWTWSPVTPSSDWPRRLEGLLLPAPPAKSRGTCPLAPDQPIHPGAHSLLWPPSASISAQACMVTALRPSYSWSSPETLLLIASPCSLTTENSLQHSIVDFRLLYVHRYSPKPSQLNTTIFSLGPLIFADQLKIQSISRLSSPHRQQPI